MKLRNFVDDFFPGCMTVDGHDEAMIGVLLRPGRPAVVVYDHQRIVDRIVQDGVDLSEAEEFVSFNVLGAYVGPTTPVFVEVVGTDWSDPSASGSDAGEVAR